MATSAVEPAPFLRRWRSLRVVVEDTSMLPTLAAGDRLWVDPRAVRFGSPPPVQSIVVLRDPGWGGRWLIKRVAAVGPSTVFVVRTGVEVRPTASDTPPPDDAIDRSDVSLGEVYVVSDGATGGRDSRSFGPVPYRTLIGVAWWRYAPRERAGPLRVSDPP
ncbi:MAG: S26 family signal peptidase [Thermoplasmata archaeon]|nr:S26 family signal peptidase [Thermoplasmata archaeon]MCI4332295.1 S26 family signal peptidase [Thermoplasmata archaeon]MCI4367908.1 S26 family signal peptidase [Thermoplasmata archaeon]